MPTPNDDPLRRLEPFLGDWSLEADFPHAPSMEVGRLTVEPIPGGGFLVQRWEVPIPEAPNGLALIGWDRDRGTYLQHYFDSRGVARIYVMGFEDGVWTLSREAPDHSPLDFRQRWTGTFSPDGDTISGTWEICHDGATWERDFDLLYRRVA